MNSFTYVNIQNMINNSRVIIVINDDVFDISNFVNKHPGGKFVINSKIGIINERYYNMHSPMARKKWLDYKIGTIYKPKYQLGNQCCTII